MKNYKKNNVYNFVSVHSIQTVCRFKINENFNFRKDIHDFPEIFYVEKGNYDVFADEELYKLNEGQILIYAPNSEHYSKPPQYAQIAVISFDIDSDKIPSLYNRVMTLNSVQKELLAKIISSGLEIFTTLPPDSDYVGMTIKNETDDFRLQMLKNELELFLLELYVTSSESTDPHLPTNQKNYNDSLTDEIVSYMKENIYTSLSLEKISTEFRISISSLKKLFKSRYDCGPKNFFINLKIEEAKRMIRDLTLNFTEISTELNFSSVHYFSKQFKEKTGLTPSEYAKSVYK